MADVQPTPKLLNILYALANSRLPWHAVPYLDLAIPDGLNRLSHLGYVILIRTLSAFRE